MVDLCLRYLLSRYQNQDAFIQQIENVELINPDSRSINLVKEQMKEQQKKSQENMKSVDELPQANLLGVKGLQWSDRPNPEKQVSEDTQVDYIPDDGELYACTRTHKS